MRHLEIKEELEELEVFKSDDLIKVEMPELSLDVCEQLMKSEFINDSTNYGVENDIAEFDLSGESELGGFCDSHKKVEQRKSRRKSLIPQRVKSENEQNGSIDNSSESSQDLPDSIISEIGLPSCAESLINSDLFNSDSELPESDDLDNIDEENIFKGMRNEAGMFMDMVKEILKINVILRQVRNWMTK